MTGTGGVQAESTMSNTIRAVLTLLGICAFFVLLAVAGLASDVLTRLLTSVDGLLLAMVSLLIAGLFLLMLFVLASEGGLLPSRHKPSGDSSAAGKPGAGK
jgi:hypothetical protein